MSLGILIVDDSLTIRMDLLELLEEANLHATACATAHDARTALAAEKFALVILDVLLPDGDGVDILKDIRANPSTADTAVILLSTESEVRDRIRGLTLGADEYVGKPYERTYLVSRAQELLRSRQAAVTSKHELILIIDDSPTFREDLKQVLEEAAYRVLTAGSGEAGLRIAADARPAAIVVDGMLPGIDGATVIRRIRLDPALRRTPCLLLTASEARRAEIEALEAGADAFVRKDESISLVLARLGAVLRSAEGQPEDQDTVSLQGPKRVLAVDDSETYLQELVEALRGEGYEVAMARSGEEALDLLMIQSVDCILLDVIMPGIGGHEVCRRVKSNPAVRNIPVLMLTAREDQEAIIEGLGAGADDYITKSSDFQVLRARVLAQIRRKQFEDENRHIREQMLRRELEASEARAAQVLAETRTALVEQARIRAEAADKAKSQFLAAMSHEIRTPMNGVVGIVELLRSTALTDEQKEMVDIIHRSGLTLLDVINDILDYSKIEAGRMSLETTAFSLTEVVETTAGIIAAHVQSKILDISCTVDPNIDEILQGDPTRLRQTVLNILGNALKFTEKGAVSIEAIAESVSDDRVVVLFEVTDSGIGIEPEKQKTLFRAFQQADDSTTRRYGGTGLGLSICKNLVELMGGEIGVRSTEGLGTTFWFRIPFARLAASDRKSSFSDYKRLLSGLRVLVYDAVQSRSAIILYLRAVNVEAIEANSIAGSLEILRTERDAGRPVGIAIIRLRIGDGSPDAVIEALNRRHEFGDVNCIFVTPHLNTGALQVAAKVPDARSVSAPVRRAKLYELVSRSADKALPEKAAADEAANVSFLPPTIDEARSSNSLILVAEDNKTNQFVIRSQLMRLGFAAEYVNDGREAWDSLMMDEDRYGLVITDCHMPVIDGYKLTGMIRDRELRTRRRRLPVVALTANALEGERDICRASGMDDYLFKPTSLKALDSVIRKWLPHAAALRRPTATPSPVTLSAIHAAVRQGPADGDEKAAVAKPPIDIAGLSNALGEDEPSHLREVLVMYQTTEANTPFGLRALARARDGAMLARVAHGAKGAARSAYAATLAKLYEELEMRAKQEDWAEIVAILAKIDLEFKVVMDFIEEFKQA